MDLHGSSWIFMDLHGKVLLGTFYTHITHILVRRWWQCFGNKFPDQHIDHQWKSGNYDADVSTKFLRHFFFRRGRFRKLCLQASWPHAAPQLARPSPTQIPRSFIIRHWNVVVTMLYTTYCTNVYYVEICRKYVYFGTLCTIYYSSLFIFILFTDSSISIHIYLLH